MKIKEVYTESDLLKKDYLTFFEILREAQEELADRIARLKT